MKKSMMMFGMLIIAFLFTTEYVDAGCHGSKRVGLFQRLRENRQSKQSNSCQTSENVTSVSNCTSCNQQYNAVTYVTTENGNQATSSCPGGICPVAPSNVVPTNYIPAPEPALPVMTNAQIPVLD